MKLYPNPVENDELYESSKIVAPLYTDPINPKLGYYYLFNEIENKIHTHFDGNTRFQSWDFARFVRSCSTMWPFLKIYRHWEYPAAKQQAINHKKEQFNFFDSCNLRFKL